MIFVNHAKNASQAKDYFTQHLGPGDGKYYMDAAEMKGVWNGQAAEMLGLSGEVTKEDFFSLCDNRHPRTGERLTRRQRDDRRVLTDFTFDVPKDVTLALEMGAEDGKGDQRILIAMQAAVRETMAEMEKDAQTRVRKKGADTDRVTRNWIWAEHLHRTTRPVNGQPDPHCHIHATVFNATFDPVEKQWKAIQLGDIVRDKGHYQAGFHARLSHKIRELGYGIEKDGNSFKIAGIDRSMIEKFSRRSDAIEKEAARLGIDDAFSKGQLGRRTREKKSKDPVSMAELRAEWGSRLTDEERLAIRTAGSGRNQGDALITAEQAKEYAMEHSFHNASAVSEKRLQAEALIFAVGSILPEDVADIAQHPEAIPVTHDRQLFVTTKTVLHHEVGMLQFAKDQQRKHKPFVSISDRDVNKLGQFVSNAESLTSLSAEQKKAALHILTTRDGVTGLVGKAGTGKTHMMRATRDVLESETGQHIYAFAPSTQASRNVLKKEGFKDADTLAMLLKNEKLQENIKGQIIWVDEAGLVSSKDMRRLMEVAKKGANRVILSGDYTQHSSVEAGDAFRLLEKEAGIRFARLTENRRQIEPGYRKAVDAISKGSGKAAQKGFDALDKMGCVIEATGIERHSLLVADYLNAVEDGKSALIIAPTHAEGQKLTDELRRALKERGVLGKEKEFIARRSTAWTNAQKGDARNYETGMVIDFHQAVAGERKQIKGKRETSGGFAKGESVVVIERRVRGAEKGTGAHENAAARTGGDVHGQALDQGEDLVVLRRDGSEAIVPLDKAERFDVYRTREVSLARGDRIRITKNGEAKIDHFREGTKMVATKVTHLNNGDIFTVEGFTKEGDIRLEKGKLLPKDWGHFSLGYVDTSYASQGKTVDRVFIATGSESIPAANQQQWYVSASRGREMAKVYVQDKQDVRDAIARTGQRLSAVELTGTKLRDSWRSRIYQSLERNRVGRFLKQRAVAVADYWRGREGMNYA